MARSRSSPAKANDQCSSPRRKASSVAGSSLSKLRVLEAVGRRSLPSLIEATVVPAVVFYVFFTTLGPTAAMLAVLVWGYGAVLRRLIGGHGVPGILQLAVIGLTVRTIVGILSGTFMYFLQPVATTLALALVFFGSLMFGRPMIARMASDFCPLAPEIASRPGVVRLFSGLTLLWAGVHLFERGHDVHAARQPADDDVRRGAEPREPGHHDQRDRAHGLVVDPDRTGRRPRVRTRRSESSLPTIRVGLEDLSRRRRREDTVVPRHGEQRIRAHLERVGRIVALQPRATQCTLVETIASAEVSISGLIVMWAPYQPRPIFISLSNFDRRTER